MPDATDDVVTGSEPTEGAGEVDEAIQAKEAEVATLREEVAALKQRNERLEDEFLVGLKARNEPPLTPATAAPTGESLDWSQFTDSERALYERMEARVQKLEGTLGQKEQALRTELVRESATKAEVQALKRENPDLWDLVSPIAQQCAAEDPSLDVRGAWDAALGKLQPYLDAKTAQDKALEESKRKAAEAEKPSATAANRNLSPEQAFDRAFDELGVADKLKAVGGGGTIR
jgi:uncharacterized protein YdcH (DUF465 family)